MDEYKEMYYVLFRAITDSLEFLYRCEWGNAVNVSEFAQEQTEEMYISSDFE